MGKQHAHGWRVSRHRLVADVTVGVIANPMSGRDIRRLVASASVFPNAEKANMGVSSRPARQRRHMIRLAMGYRSSSGRCAPSRHPAEDYPQVLIIARDGDADPQVTLLRVRRSIQGAH